MRFELGKLELFGLDLGNLWQRWWRGINSLLPLPLADVFLHPAPKVRVHLSADSLQFVRELPGQAPQELLSLGRAEFELLEDNRLHEQLVTGTDARLLQLEVVLPTEQVLSRRLSMPVAVRSNLREALGFQISRLTPFTRDQVLFDVVEHGVDTQRGLLELELLVVPRSFADNLVRKIETVSGLPVARLQVPLDSQQRNTTNLLGQVGVPSRWYRRLNRNSWLAVLLAGCMGLAVLAPVIKLRMMVVQNKNETVALQSKVADTREGWYGLQRSAADLEFVLEQRAGRGDAVAILDELTRIVPDGFHLTSFTLEKNQLEISGQGPAAVELVELLNASDMFMHARFVSAVTRGNNKQDVFTIGMVVAGRAGEQQ